MLIWCTRYATCVVWMTANGPATDQKAEAAQGFRTGPARGRERPAAAPTRRRSAASRSGRQASGAIRTIIRLRPTASIARSKPKAPTAELQRRRDDDAARAARPVSASEIASPRRDGKPQADDVGDRAETGRGPADRHQRQRAVELPRAVDDPEQRDAAPPWRRRPKRHHSSRAKTLDPVADEGDHDRAERDNTR